MKATITIDMDNAAFEETPGPELARILKSLAVYVKYNCEPVMVERLQDVNGNTVGEMRIEEK